MSYRILIPTFVLTLQMAMGQSLVAAERPRHVVLISVDGLSATYFDDNRAPLPTLRSLARQGAVAEGMITSFPSVTWPSHVSLVTGVSPGTHGVVANRVIDRKTGKEITYVGDPTFTKEECVRSPTLYDAVSAAGMTAASIIWPACNGAKTLNWVIPDSNRSSIHQRFTTPGLVEELDQAGISIAKLGRWGWKKEFAPARDSTYSRVAVHLLNRHRPNLLLLHLITPDQIEHVHGPHTEEAYWAVGNADDRIREIWEILNKSPLAGNSTLFVVSDHGFAAYDKMIYPNILFQQEGLIKLDADGGFDEKHVWSQSSGGSAMIYLLDEANKEPLRTKVRRLLAQLEGVDRVLGFEEFKQYGLPNPAENPQQGDLIAVVKPGYAFGNDYKGTDAIEDVGSSKGTHGHLPEPHYMHATFVAAGAGIRSGTKLKTISNLDVAPTIARLLEVPLPTAEGRVLTEILETR